MIGTIIGALIGGLFLGALARLIMPGKQNIGVLMTMVLGLAGSLIGTAIVYSIGYHNEHGFKWIPFFVGLVVAIFLIGGYIKLTGRDKVKK